MGSRKRQAVILLLMPAAVLLSSVVRGRETGLSRPGPPRHVFAL